MPQWNIFEIFQINDVSSALKRDATDGVQLVQVDVSHPDEISSLFDSAIVYAKEVGSCRCYAIFWATTILERACRYISNATNIQIPRAKTFWDTLSEASGQNIDKFMNSWLLKPGYPVVNVTMDNDDLILTQEQFFIGNHENHQREWILPLDGTDPLLPKNDGR